MIYIEARGLNVGYEDKPVSRDIHFSLEKGDYICIVGENGAGKSTLVKTLLGLLPPLSGEISFLNGIGRRDIGYFPQQSSVQRDFPATVLEIVLSGTMSGAGRLFYTPQDKERAKLNLERMGILALKDKSYRKLSGGQQQRVLLARALCAASKILLLDEPVNSLDPKAGADFYALVRRLNEEGISILMVSHDIQAAADYANKILHIGRKQVFFGETAEYVKSPAWEFLSGIGENDG